MDPYSLEGTEFLAGVTERINGAPLESCTSPAMKLGWRKADEAIMQGDDVPPPVDAPPPTEAPSRLSRARRLRVPAVITIGALAAVTGGYAFLAYRNAESAPVIVADDIPELSRDPGHELSSPDLAHDFHVVMTPPTAVPVPPPVPAAVAPVPPSPIADAVASEPSVVPDVLEQLRIIENTRRMVTQWNTEAAAKVRRGHHVAAPSPETATDLLRQGDALQRAGDVAGAIARYGRAAQNGTSAAALEAADRLNHPDESH